MPYEGEFAQYRSIHRLATSPRVAGLRGRCEVRTAADLLSLIPLAIQASVQGSNRLPRYIVAIDGSKQEIPIENGYPGAEVSYVTVASVMLDVELLRQLDSMRPVAPKLFRSVERADCIDSAFPGANVVVRGDISAKASLRRLLWETLSETRMSIDGETLLDTYEALLAYKSTGSGMAWPYEGEGCNRSDKKYRQQNGAYQCDCSLERPLYATDALRIHEGMNPAAGNGAMFAEIMQVLERIWIIHVLRTIEQLGWVSSLRRLAFVLDGPLAVFGHPAWLSDAIFRELKRLNGVARTINGEDLLLIGIEKSGVFASHLEALDRNRDGSEGRLRPESLMLLTDEYIKNNVIFSTSERPYGDQTYFGRKFCYKTRSGALIVASLPYLVDEHKDLSRSDADLFPRLEDALSVINALVSSRYPNSLIPLIAAHAEAAIPLNLGQRVLEQLARELVSASP